MKLSFVAVWLLLLVGCGTASRVVRLDTGGTAPLTFEPHSRATPVRLEPDEFKTALAIRAREVQPPVHVQEAARRLFAMDARTGSFEYDSPTRRLSALGSGDTLQQEPTQTDTELARDYLRWCKRTGRPGDCLHLLEGGSSLGGDGRYTLAMALAKDRVLNEMLEAFKDMADPHAMVSAVLWTCTTYMLLLTVPEPVSKGIAAVMTATLVAYVGVDTFWGLLLGFKRLAQEADRATTFHELREAGERYGKVMGRNSARAFAMLAAVAIGNTAPGLAAKVPKLPGYEAASAIARTQGGFRLSAVAEIQSVAIPATGEMTIVLAPGAVAAMVMGPKNEGPGSISASGGSPEKPLEIRPPVARHRAWQVDQRTMAKSTNSVIEARVDVKADIEAIRTGHARIGRTPGGEVSYSVNGRTYGAHSNGTLYPMEGDGIHVLDRGAFQALGVYNKFGNTPRAAEILDNMGVGATQRANALSVWKTHQ